MANFYRQSYDTGNEEGGMSKFNAAALKMKRLHEAQEMINICNLNILAFNDVYQKYNYEIVFSSLNILFQETYSKLSDKEIKNCLSKINIIKYFFNKYPIHKKSTHPNGEKTMLFDGESWKFVQEELKEYESMIRMYLDKHGYDSPEQDDSALF